jgi:multiple sugar transport system permease protein
MRGKRSNPLFWAAPLTVLLVISLLPYLWIVLASFKARPDLLTQPPRWVFSPTFENYRQILVEKGFDTYLMNSLTIGIASTVIAVTVGTLAAYGFSRFKVPAGNHIFFYVLATRLGPPVAYALPMYLVFFKLGLINLEAGVILAHATFNMVLVIWMMKSFFDEVPREVEEAAYLDGCSHLRVFLSVSMPLSYPGLVTVAIFVLIFSWNELLFALILSAGQMRTMTVMIPSLVLHTGTLWGEVAAASVIQSVPVLIFTFIIQKRLIRGLTFGAIKG